MVENSTNKEMNFVYGNDDERIKVTYLENTFAKYSRYYQANYEREENTLTGDAKEWTYIYAPTGLAAVFYKPTATATGQLLYALTDHLGSPVMLTNQAQQIQEEYSFDAWGRRRNPADWSYTNVTTPAILNRGFTMHEHINEFSLINMNGRIYDAVMGRFMQPDNQVQDPGFIQTFNKYAYVFNNPLSFTDPSGWAGGGSSGSGNGNSDDPPKRNSVYYSVYQGFGTSIIGLNGDYYIGGYYKQINTLGGNPTGVGSGTGTRGSNALTGLTNSSSSSNGGGRGGNTGGRGNGGGSGQYVLSISQNEQLLTRSSNSYNGTYLKSESNYNYSGNGESYEKRADDINYILNGVDTHPYGENTVYRVLEVLARDVNAPTNQENVEALDDGFTAIFAISPISVIRPGRLSVSESSLEHIFRNAPGHVNPTSIASKERYLNLFSQIASNPNNIVKTINSQAAQAGVLTYKYTFRNGKTVWVQTFKGALRNAGVN